MKKAVLMLGLVLSTSLLISGGNIAPALPKVADIPNSCYAEKTYTQIVEGLMWQDQKYTDSEDGAYANERSLGKAGKWNHALNYCRRLNYAGYTDWRLPTSDELANVHHIDGQVFQYFRDKDFWTSTPTTEGKYYVIYPADATPYKRSKRQSNFIRCVRCTGEIINPE
jgi:hypothetical protein